MSDTNPTGFKSPKSPNRPMRRMSGTPSGTSSGTPSGTSSGTPSGTSSGTPSGTSRGATWAPAGLTPAGLAPEARQRRIAERQAYVAPLFAYLSEHYISAIAVTRRAAAAVGLQGFYRQQLNFIKRGRRPAPVWLIPGVCREIGQPVETVMGQEWAQRHLPLPDGDIGAGASADTGAGALQEKKAS